MRAHTQTQRDNKWEERSGGREIRKETETGKQSERKDGGGEPHAHVRDRDGRETETGPETQGHTGIERVGRRETEARKQRHTGKEGWGLVERELVERS